jgi:hypothetical protein
MKQLKRTLSDISVPQTISSVPYISIDGIKFFADRFYLNAPTGLDGFHAISSSTQKRVGECACQEPPPLFDIVKLVDSLDLEAAIVSTYTMDLGWMHTAMPTLFPQFGKRTLNSVPTLVLHGTKGLKLRQQRKGTPWIPTTEKDMEVNETTDHMNRYYRDKIRKEERKKRRKSIKQVIDVIELDDSSDDDIEIISASSYGKECIQKAESFECGESDDKITPSQINSADKHDIPDTFADSVYITEILPTYVPSATSVKSMKGFNLPRTSLKKDVISIDISDDESVSSDNQTIGVDEDIVSKRKAMLGVHHPKYYLLFEKSGSLVVVVSTANLTAPTCVDGTWVQRFNKKAYADEGYSIDEMHSRYDGSDFGFILTDFLSKQSDAAEVSSIIPEQFLKKHLPGFCSLHNFPNMYEFETSQVHLISTVPGFHPNNVDSDHLVKSSSSSLGFRVHYGSQRVADILDKVTEKSKLQRKISGKRPGPWLPSTLLSKNDKLIIQTTSIGSKWTSLELQDLMHHYMGESESDIDDPLGNVEVIWPSMDFMARTAQAYSKLAPLPNIDISGFSFFSSEAFNESDLLCLQRLKRYEPSSPEMITVPALPHIKTYARLLERDEKDKKHLAWAMLTSACLSKGAQGFTEKNLNNQELRGYSNFELGVLFVSRMKEHQSGRLYSCYSQRCQCDSENGGAVVPLPFPYDIRPLPYQDTPGSEDFCETPYFHQVTANSITRGKCLLTPYGKYLSQQIRK